jgi:WD40 repeat protein
MPRLLLIDPSRSAIGREAGEALLADLRGAGVDVEPCGATPGLAALDRQLATCDALLLVEPLRWWPRSAEHALRRPWLARITEHVEFDRRNRLGAVAGHGRHAAPSDGQLAGLAWFRGRADERQALLDWIAASREPAGPFDFAIDEPILGDRRRDDLLAAIDAGLAASPLLAITGPIGSGKTRLLRDWLRRGSPSWTVAHHFALPEHRATQRSNLVERSLARQLHPSATTLRDALDHASANQAGQKTVLVLDGLEHLDDPRVLVHALPTEHRERVRWLVGARLGHAPFGAPTIDLGAPSWRSTSTLIEALATEAARLDESDRRALIGRAAGNLGYLAALGEETQTRTTKAQLQAQTRVAGEGTWPVLPRRFEAELARALGRLMQLPIADRRRADQILGLLALASEPMPAAILLTCLDRSLVLATAIEPVRELLCLTGLPAEPTLALYHPALGECLRFELDPGAGHERALLEGIDRAVAERPSPSVQAFQATHAPNLRRKFATALTGWIGDLDKLVEYVRAQGPLKLEHQLEGERGDGVEDLLAIVRARQAALVGAPERLPELLWNGLLDRGWSTSELSERLRWPSKPTLRLRRTLEHADRCWRSLPHPERVHGCAISSDGNLILSACNDGRVRLWSRVSGEQLAAFEHGGSVRACAMTPDGHWAVSGGSDKSIKRWDLRTRKAAGECKLGGNSIVALAIDKQGMRVIAGEDQGRVVVWRPAEGSSKELCDHDERMAGVAISANGKLGISGGKLDVAIWDLDVHGLIATLPDHEYTIGGIAIGAKGRRGYSIAIGESRRFELKTGKIEQTYADLGRSIACCVAIGDSDELLVGEGQRLGPWDLAEGKPKHTIHAHAGGIEACATTPDASWAVSVGDTQLKIWPRAAFEGASTARWTSARLIVAASPDGTQAIVGGDEYQLSIVDVASGQVRGTLEVGGRTNAVAWIDDDRLLTLGATSHEIALWSVGRRKRLLVRELSGDWLRACAISSDRRRALIVGDEKQTWLVELDDLRDRSLGSHADWVHACRFSSDGALALAADGDAELMIWSLADRSRRHRLKSSSNHSYSALATIDDLAFAAGPSALDVWDIRAGKQLASLTAHTGKIHALTLADEGRVLISAGEDATLRLWKVGREPSVLASVVGHAPFTSVSLAGSLMLAGDAAGNLWELAVDWRGLA